MESTDESYEFYESDDTIITTTSLKNVVALVPSLPVPTPILLGLDPGSPPQKTYDAFNAQLQQDLIHSIISFFENSHNLQTTGASSRSLLRTTYDWSSIVSINIYDYCQNYYMYYSERFAEEFFNFNSSFDLNIPQDLKDRLSNFSSDGFNFYQHQDTQLRINSVIEFFVDKLEEDYRNVEGRSWFATRYGCEGMLFFAVSVLKRIKAARYYCLKMVNIKVLLYTQNLKNIKYQFCYTSCSHFQYPLS